MTPFGPLVPAFCANKVFTLFSGIEKCGAAEINEMSRCAVRICCGVGCATLDCDVLLLEYAGD